MGAGFSLHKDRVLVGYRRNTAYCVVFGVSIEKYCIHNACRLMNYLLLSHHCPYNILMEEIAVAFSYCNGQG